MNFILATAIAILTALKINKDILLDIDTVEVFNGLLVFPFLYLFTVMVLLVFTWFAWTGVKDTEKRPYWELSGRIHYSILVLLSTIMISIFASWHFFLF